jgi:hypothetical protein
MTATTFTDAVWRAFRARHLTPLHRDVLLRLATFRGRGGLIFPSHATVATRARCSARTVQRALDAARDLGLVTWRAVWRRVGWSSRRTANVYTLGSPMIADAGQNARGVLRTENPLILLVDDQPMDHAAARDALARRRAAMEERLLRNKVVSQPAGGNAPEGALC